MDNYINVIMEDGTKYKIEVIDIFNLDEYEEKEYIVYSLGEEVNDDQEKIYVSIIENKDDTYNLIKIEDEKEWEKVQEKIANLINEETENE